MAPVAAGLEVAQAQLLAQSQLDHGGVAGDLAGVKLEAATRALVVEKNHAGGMQAVSLAIVASQIKARDFGDSVSGARVKAGLLGLRRFLCLAKHLAGPGEVEPARRSDLAER